MLRLSFCLLLLVSIVACGQSPEGRVGPAIKNASQANANVQPSGQNVPNAQPISQTNVTNDQGHVLKFKNGFFLSCVREMTSGADALPVGLSGSICTCAAHSLTTSFTEQQLREIDVDATVAFARVTPVVDACTNVEVPKYLEANPEFLKSYMARHPELLDEAMREVEAEL